MKRFFKYLGAFLAGALVFSSCVEEEFVTYNPDNATAQTLGEIAGCTLNAEAEPITTTYTEVDFGVTVPAVYSLYVGAQGSGKIDIKLAANIADGNISIAHKDLNSVLLNMGTAPETSVAVDFQLVAQLANDKGAAVAGDSTYVQYSNVVTATFTTYNTTVLDVDKFEHIWVIGAAESIGAWAHDKVYQYLYNYNGDGNTYTGMIYYTDGAAGGWKLTGGAGWDNGNWGSEAQAEEPEAASVTLIDDGGSKDIKCYSLPYYMWTFDKSTLELKKEFGFTTMGIVGSFNEWNAADENCVMTYNAYLHRFYIDYEFAADAELKFTADGKWDLNFGKDMAQGGDNIPVTAGKYRIYIDFNKNEYTFDANMFGKTEPGLPAVEEEPKPDTPANVGWGIVGTINEWGATADIAMAVDPDAAGWFVAKGFEIPADAQFKFRKDGGWDANFGAPGDVEPFALTADAKAELAAGGKNLTIAAGTYDVYFNPDVPAAYFMTAGGTAPAAPEIWGLVGTITDWGGADLDWGLTLDEDEKFWVRKGVEFPADAQFKFRYMHDWGENLGGTGDVEPFALTADAATVLAAGGKNLTIAAGKYDVYLDVEAKTAYFMTEGSTPAAGEETPEVDPWETAASYVNGAEATDDALMKEIRAYADETNLYIRLTAVAALEGANYVDVSFCDGNGETAAWWGWTTTGTATYWKEHKGTLDAEGNLTAMQFKVGDEYKDIVVSTEKTADSIMWYLTYPREYVDAYMANGKTYVAALLWNEYEPYYAVPARWNAMLEVTLP